MMSLRALVHSHAPEHGKPASKRSRRALVALGIVAAVTGALGVLALRIPQRHETKPTFVVGRASPRKSESGRDERWLARSLTLTLDPSLNAIHPGAHQAVEDAFDAWSSTDARLPSLTFDVSTQAGAVGSEPDGVNRVAYAPIPFDEHRDDLAITLSYVDATTGEILEADIIVNARQRFEVLPIKSSSAANDRPSCSGSQEVRCGGAFDLTSVLAHEAGHFFGLGEDRDDGLNTMFECTGRCETHKRDLASDDIGAIDSLYAVEGSEEATQASVGCNLSRTPPPDASIAVTMLGLLAMYRRRRTASRRRSHDDEAVSSGDEMHGELGKSCAEPCCERAHAGLFRRRVSEHDQRLVLALRRRVTDVFVGFPLVRLADDESLDVGAPDVPQVHLEAGGTELARHLVA
jgi:hypothetical protein